MSGENPEDEVCAACGNRLGYHGASSNACPGSTFFLGTGKYREAEA